VEGLEPQALGPLPTVWCEARDLKAQGKFLIDTGANVSLVLRDALVDDIKVDKRSLHVRSSTDKQVPLKGGLHLTLSTATLDFPPYYFWVVDRDPSFLGGFVGIIGTDILSDLDAVVDCSARLLNCKAEQTAVPLSLEPPLRRPQAFNLHAESSRKTDRKSGQIVAPSWDQVVPPRTLQVIYGTLPYAVQRNAVYEIPSIWLHAAGVILTPTAARIRTDGTIPLPVLNISDSPYSVPANRLIAMATVSVSEYKPMASDPADRVRSDDGHALSPHDASAPAGAYDFNPRGGWSRAKRRQFSSHAARSANGKEVPGLEDRPGDAPVLAEQPTASLPETPMEDKETRSAGPRRNWAPTYSDHTTREDVDASPAPIEPATVEKTSTSQQLVRRIGELPENQPEAPEWGGQPDGRGVNDAPASEANVIGRIKFGIRGHRLLQPGVDIAGTPLLSTDSVPGAGPMVKIEGENAIPENPSLTRSASPDQPTPHDNQASMEEFCDTHEHLLERWEGLLPPPRGPLPMADGMPLDSMTCRCNNWHEKGSKCPSYLGNRLPPARAMTLQVMHDLIIEEHLRKAAKASQLPPDKVGKLENLLLEYKDIFRRSGNKTQTCKLFEQSIPLTDNVPVRVNQYPIAKSLRVVLNERIQEFLDAGVVKPSNSGYNAPLCLAKKKDGTWRPVVDFKQLNKKIIHDPFPLPLIQELINEFRGAYYLSLGDLFWGFYHVKVKEEDTHKLAFTTDTGRYEFLYLPMGLKISPAVFQRLMNMILSDCLGLFALVYMDDVIMYSPSEEQHFKDLQTIFQRFREVGLAFKIEKCSFFQSELTYLGFIVGREGVRLDPGKIASVVNFPRPETRKQLQAFLGLVGYFKRHIAGFAGIARPLYDLLKDPKDAPTPPTANSSITKHWGAAQEAAFQELKRVSTTAPVLMYPDFSKPFILTTDASAHALGYVLSQQFADGEHPIAYGSRSLRGPELNYGNTDREMLAVIQGVLTFRTYLAGHHFTIRTDHQAIVQINKGYPSTSRAIKWMLALQDYDFEIVYTPGTKLRHADALSRVEWNKTEEPPQENPHASVQDPIHRWKREAPEDLMASIPEGNVFLILNQDQVEVHEPVLDLTEWAQLQVKDDSLKAAFEEARKGAPPYSVKEDILYKTVDGQPLPVVPESLRKAVIRQFHEPPAHGHLGPERTFQGLRRYVTWPSLRADIEEFIRSCDACQRHKRSYLRVPLQHQRIPPTQFHTVSMDVVGPVPTSTTGDSYILVLQDMLSRWVEFVALRRANARTVVNAFMKVWVTRYGVPHSILTDRGSEFVNAFSQGCYDFLGVQRIKTTAYRPQGNGANERMHQELKKFFSIYLEGRSKAEWASHIGEARWAYNTAYHSSLGMSPYEALFAVKPPMGPLGIPQAQDHPENFKQFYGAHKQQILDTRKRIQQMIARSQDTVLDRRNAHAHRIPFKIGDWVLMKNQRPKTKWDPKFLGPWQVSDVVSPVVFELDIDGNKYTAHATYLKAYHGTVPTNTVSEEGKQVPSNEDGEEEEEETAWYPGPWSTPDTPAVSSERQHSERTTSTPAIEEENSDDEAGYYVPARTQSPLRKAVASVSKAARRVVRFRPQVQVIGPPESLSTTRPRRAPKEPQRYGDWTT
jgi:transposase InsO family protein